MPSATDLPDDLQRYFVRQVVSTDDQEAVSLRLTSEHRPHRARTT